jgi:hypothetical protein
MRRERQLASAPAGSATLDVQECRCSEWKPDCAYLLGALDAVFITAGYSISRPASGWRPPVTPVPTAQLKIDVSETRFVSRKRILALPSGTTSRFIDFEGAGGGPMTADRPHTPRLHKRTGFIWPAQILATSAKDDCTVLDISDCGACLKFTTPPPDFFVLQFTCTGSVQRMCRLRWCQGDKAGVEFIDDYIALGSAATAQPNPRYSW